MGSGSQQLTAPVAVAGCQQLSGVEACWSALAIGVKDTDGTKLFPNQKWYKTISLWWKDSTNQHQGQSGGAVGMGLEGKSLSHATHKDNKGVYHSLSASQKSVLFPDGVLSNQTLEEYV